MRLMIAVGLLALACSSASEAPETAPDMPAPTGPESEPVVTTTEIAEPAEPEPPPPPPVLGGTVEGIAARDDESFDEDPSFHALMIQGEPMRRPSGRRIGWMWAHSGPWSLVPIDEAPSPYVAATLTGEDGLCQAAITRMRRFWASKPDHSLGGVHLTSFRAFEIEPGECQGDFGFVGAEVHEISIEHPGLRPAPPRLRRRIEAHDAPNPDWPVQGWDGTVRALRLPRYDFVLISGQSLFLLHDDELSSATGLKRIFEADGRGLFLVWESPSETWIERAEESLAKARPLRR